MEQRREDRCKPQQGRAMGRRVAARGEPGGEQDDAGECVGHELPCMPRQRGQDRHTANHGKRLLVPRTKRPRRSPQAPSGQRRLDDDCDPQSGAILAERDQRLEEEAVEARTVESIFAAEGDIDVGAAVGKDEREAVGDGRKQQDESQRDD